MNNNTCVIFDLDGTLLNTWDIHLKTCYDTVLEVTGKKLRMLEIIRSNRVTERETLITLLGNEDCEKALELYKTKFINNLELCKVEKYGGICDIVEQLYYKNIPIGLFTGRSRKTTMSLLKKEGLTEYFKSITTSDDVIRPKPSEEGLEKTVEELSGVYNKSLYIGDSVIDIKIANKLNVSSIFVNWNQKLVPPQLSNKVKIVDNPSILSDEIKKFIERCGNEACIENL